LNKNIGSLEGFRDPIFLALNDGEGSPIIEGGISAPSDVRCLKASKASARERDQHGGSSRVRIIGAKPEFLAEKCLFALGFPHHLSRENHGAD